MLNPATVEIVYWGFSARVSDIDDVTQRATENQEDIPTSTPSRRRWNRQVSGADSERIAFASPLDACECSPEMADVA